MTTREQIIEAADLLFYHQGYAHTSFSHIADAVKISRGNFYYHFKTKDAILDAVITSRLVFTKGLLKQWEDASTTPTERILSFVHILITNQDKIIRYGCPVGTLNAELAKIDHPFQPAANKLFMLFRTWLKKQFIQLGCNEKADDYALHLLARSQGVASLANSFKDKKFIAREIDFMGEWLKQCCEKEALN